MPSANEELREENAGLRGKLEVARPVEGEATDEALRLGAAEAQEQAAEDRRTTVFWRKEAKDAKANHEQAVKDLADASSEIQRLKTLLELRARRQQEASRRRGPGVWRVSTGSTLQQQSQTTSPRKSPRPSRSPKRPRWKSPTCGRTPTRSTTTCSGDIPR